MHSKNYKKKGQGTTLSSIVQIEKPQSGRSSSSSSLAAPCISWKSTNPVCHLSFQTNKTQFSLPWISYMFLKHSMTIDIVLHLLASKVSDEPVVIVGRICFEHARWRKWRGPPIFNTRRIWGPLWSRSGTTKQGDNISIALGNATPFANFCLQCNI